MTEATPIHAMTSRALRAEQPRRGPRTTLRGGVVLMLAWMALEGAFLFDVARRPPGAGAWESSATAQADPVALARSSPAPRSR